MEYHCPKCKKIIIEEDIKKYLKKYPKEKWMMCPYCKIIFSVKEIKEELKNEHK
jgi:DNA-directed RNA polymerase subunit RPC12/RpoP